MNNEFSKEVIAKVVKLFGNKGELVLRLMDGFPDKVETEEPLFVDIDGLRVPLFISSFKRNGADKAVVAFDDFDTEYRASELVGKELYALVEAEEEDDEIYWEDTAGYTFMDLVSGMAGIVERFHDYTDNPLLEVNFSGDSVLVPVNDFIISSVDSDEKMIEARLPDGLINLYSDNDYDE